ncbi:MAG: crtI [Rickettsiaceae bacterium]|nr:crtI [Rickettsiaceae bacterium]
MSTAIVIGSGLGGIAAAIRLRAKGNKVTILERQNDAGGRARCFTEDGYIFDAGPTVITAPYLFSELFDLFGKRIEDYAEIKALSPVWYDYKFADGFSFSYGPKEYFIDQIKTFAPEEVDSYLKLVAHAEKLFLSGYENLADKSFNSFMFMLKALPTIIQLQGWQSIYSLIKSYIKNPYLIQALCVPSLLLGGNPFKVSAIYFLIHVLEQKYGVHYVKGGTNSLIKALIKLAEEQGVEVKCGKTVEHFDFQGAKIIQVNCEDKSIYKSDIVISNIDPKYLYNNIIPVSKQALFTKLRSLISKDSFGLYVIYFATNKKYSNIEQHTVGFSLNFKNIIQDIFEVGKLPEDFSFYLHRPTASDSSLAPEGHDIFYVLVPVPNLLLLKASQKQEEQFVTHIMSELERRMLPGLSKSITVQFYKGPSYFKDELLSYAGAGFSIQPTLTQSAWFRFHNKDPYLENLYLVGAGTHPGAGMPGVLNSAKILEMVLI